MKRIAIFLMIAVMGTAAFAAKPTKPVNPASVKAGASITTASEGIKALAIGTSLGFPNLKYRFNEDFAGSLGAVNISSGTAALAGTALMARVDYNLQKAGDVQPYVGIYYVTNGAPTATTVLGGVWGIYTMIQPNFSIGLDWTLISSTTNIFGIAGVNSTGILGSNPNVAPSGVTINAAFYL